MGACQLIKNCAKLDHEPKIETFMQNEIHHLLSRIVGIEAEMPVYKNDIDLRVSSLLDPKTNTLNPPNYLPNTIYFNGQIFEQIVKKNKKIQKVFVDNTFVISSKETKDEMLALIKENHIANLNAHSERISDIFFLRYPRDIIQHFKSDNFSLVQYSSSNQVKFNPLGNPNLFNALIYLNLKDKYFFKNILYDFNYDTRTFCIKLFYKNLTKLVCLDEEILINDSYTPFFIIANEKIFWISLIEKAIAKVNHTYSCIVNKLSSYFIPFLTNFPMTRHSHKSMKENKVWGYLKDSISKNNICFAENGEEEKITFYVMGVFVVNKTRYIELIVPEFREIDKEFVEEIKKKVFINETDLKDSRYFPDSKLHSEKVLFMQFDFYMKFFANTYVVFSNTSYFSNSAFVSLKQINEREPKCFIGKIKSLMFNHLFFTVHFHDDENFILPIRVVLAKVEGKNDTYVFTYITSFFFSTKEDISVPATKELNLDPGMYYFFVTQYHQGTTRNAITVSTFSSAFVEILNLTAPPTTVSDMDISISTNLPKIYSSLFESYLSKEGIKQAVDNCNHMKYTHSFSDKNFGYSVLEIENKSEDMIMYIQLFYETSGMKLITPLNRKSDMEYIIITPKKKSLIVFEWEATLEHVHINFNQKTQLKPYFFGDLSFEYAMSVVESLPKYLVMGESDVYYSFIQGMVGMYFILENVGKDLYEVSVCISLKDKDESLTKNVDPVQLNPYDKETMFIRCDPYVINGELAEEMNIEVKCKKL